MTAIDVLAVIIILLVPFNWGVAVFMWRLLRRNPDLTTLRSRAFTQVVLSVCASIGGVLALNHFLVVRLPQDLWTLALAALVTLPSLPGMYWLYEYLRGSF